MRVTAIVVGAGSSARMKGTDKLQLKLGGITVFERSLRAFCEHPEVEAVVAVTREDLIPAVSCLMEKYDKLTAVVAGGSSRCLSVQQGIAAAPRGTEYYAIHDAARPFVSEALISNVLAAAQQYGAAAPAMPVTDTVKRVDADERIAETVPRSELRAVMTPQVFRADRYRKAAAAADSTDTDDCLLFERMGWPVKLVEGEAANFKITTAEDIKRARMQVNDFDIRIGHGYDVHKLVEGRALILGGVTVPYEKGLLGHSDADVLLHAVSDAILGAAALRDIGVHFPDNDPAYKGADSRVLLRRCVELAAEKGFCVANADATILCQRPKLKDHIESMRQNIAADLALSPDAVNVKATTEEGLGFTGEGLGISAHAVVLLRRV